MNRVTRVGMAVFLTLAAAAGARAQTVTLTINLAGPTSGTVGVIPSGTLCSTPTASCPVAFTSGTVVTLVANVPAGTTAPGLFSGGTGSATACGTSTCAFTITADSSVTATFDPSNGPLVTITTNFGGDGQGEVGVGNSRRQNFDPAQGAGTATVYVKGSVVSMQASQAAESRFSGYSNGTNGAAACGTASVCSFTANADASVTANFSVMTSLSVNPSAASINAGKTQTYTAMGTFSDGVTEAVAGNLGTWRTKSTMPTARHALALAVANGKIFAIGGDAASAPSAVVEAYDPNANSWSTVASMPTAREGLGTATVSNLVYAIGGNVPGSTPTAAVERYDPVANTWTARASLSAPRRFLSAAQVNGIIYAIGGETVSGAVSTTVATVEAYDPVANTWTTKAPMHTARKFFGVAVADGLIYAMGTGTMEVYDPATDTWTNKAALPGGRTVATAASADGVVYAFEPSNGSTPSNTVMAYDAVRDAWGFKKSLPTARAEMAATTFGGLVYVVGGFFPTNATKLKTVEAFTDMPRWTSSDKTIATISQQAIATGIAVGQATITATVGGSASCSGNTCGALTVTKAPVTMTLDRPALTFAATRSGNAFINTTTAQNVRMTQSGAGSVSWTATPSDPWIHISPTSGTGSAIFGVSVAFDSSLPTSGSKSGSISIQLTGADNTAGPIAVTLNVEAAGTSTAPFGQIDTPLNNATGVAGSLPVTGWALDDIGLLRVRVTRDPIAGEPQGAQIFIGNATFIDGARPDVAGQFPNTPAGTAGGWGYLMLTNFLPNGGNGTFRLNVFADDVDGHTTLLGTRTITCNNGASTLPFGAIDTPDQGQTVSGSVTNFGWVLSPGTRRADPTGGGTVTVFIDGVAAGTPGGWAARSDLTALFPAGQYSGINNALGVFGFDSTTLSNGVHTIAWGVSDNLGGSAGVGSRFFTVSNGSSLRAYDASVAQAFRPTSFAVGRPEGLRYEEEPILGRRGFDPDAPWRTYIPDANGLVTIQSEEIDRLELQIGAGAAAAWRSGGQLVALPPGSHLDPAAGIFTWNPGVGFIGAYDFVFGGRDVRIVLNPKGSNRVGPQTVIDAPGVGQAFRPDTAFILGGWAADLDSPDGTGIDAVHVWAYPVSPEGVDPRAPSSGYGPPIWIGPAFYGGARPDVAGVYGDRFVDSGYGIVVTDLPPGTYDLAVFAHSTVRGAFSPAKVVRVVVR